MNTMEDVKYIQGLENRLKTLEEKMNELTYLRPFDISNTIKTLEEKIEFIMENLPASMRQNYKPDWSLKDLWDEEKVTGKVVGTYSLWGRKKDAIDYSKLSKKEEKKFIHSIVARDKNTGAMRRFILNGELYGDGLVIEELTPSVTGGEGGGGKRILIELSEDVATIIKLVEKIEKLAKK